MTSGRWKPTPEQISTIVDCAAAHMPLEKAAALVGVKPRSLLIFAKRIGKPFPAPAGRARAAETLAPVHPKPEVPPAVPRLLKQTGHYRDFRGRA
jgi:hypothetical protein